ncbi:MAG TPA: D-alanyl-D-alanine carboxypeptidase family protein [Burkholderiales bacterium]|nr:D-alanyl-D-alanine carboxypeptidase family protein [Burkholderiales bacterium]
MATLKRALFLALASLCAAGTAYAQAQQPPQVAGRAFVVTDLSSGQVLAAEKADERVEPASLTKLMTAYLVFAALREGRIALQQQVQVSERAWRAPGSRTFLELGKAVSVETLLHGMVVQSGNDASIALAETLAGSEALFAQLMNREAARLGMTQSRFANATGLPDAQHYSSARDLALLGTALIRDFPQEYARYYPMKEFRHNDITQMNRNRLLWLDPSVDGVKTGFTQVAGYCLIASSERGGRRLLTVLLGADSEAARARESQTLLNWGYQFFDGVRLYEPGQAVRAVDVWKGAEDAVKVGFERGLVVTVPRGEAKRLAAELLTHPPVFAPVQKGDKVGVLRVALDGKPLGEYPVVALESVPQAGVFGRAWDTLRLWFR